MSAVSATPASAATPSTSLPAPPAPELYMSGDHLIQVTQEVDGLKGHLGLYEVIADGQTTYLSRRDVDQFLTDRHARPLAAHDSRSEPHGASAYSADPPDLEHLPLYGIGKCTFRDDGDLRSALIVPKYNDRGAPSTIGQGPGTGATAATPWDQRFQRTPTLHEQFQQNMELNSQINLLNVGQVVLLEMAGRDHSPYLEQTAPLTNAAVAVGGAYVDTAAMPKLEAPRPDVTPTPTPRGPDRQVGKVQAGVAASEIPGARFVKVTDDEAAIYRVSAIEGRELSETEFRDGRVVRQVGGLDETHVWIAPDVVRTLHTHPEMVALPSGQDIATFGNACYPDATVHEILGDRWGHTREVLESWGHDQLPFAPIKYTVTSGEVRAAGAVPVIVPIVD